jgi:hypothetical protein
MPGFLCSRASAPLLVLVVASTTSCGGRDGGGPTNSPDPRPTAIAALTETALRGTAGVAVTTPPSVKVVSASGAGVSGVTVTFAVTTGGGTITGNTRTTDANGVATIGSWTLGTNVGANALTASVPQLTAITFSATGEAGPPAKARFATAPPSTARNRIALSTAPVVQLDDQFGNPVAQSGVPVTASLASGGGALRGTTTVSTDASGAARFADLHIAGTVGPRTLAFTATGFPPISATVSLTGGAASMLAINGGDNAVALVGTAVSPSPSVRVVDADVNPVAGVSVTFTIASGSGTVVGASATSDANGIATVGSWRVGSIAGRNTLTATIATAEAPASITFNATARPPLLATITPTLTASAPLGRRQFDARDELGGSATVTWRVNGVTGGTAATGTISSTGEFTAAAAASDSVVITAIAAADTTRKVSATVLIVPTESRATPYYMQFPRVVDATRPGRTRIIVLPPSGTVSMTFFPISGVQTGTPLTDLGNGIMLLDLAPQVTLAGFVTASLHNTLGFLDCFDASGTRTRRTSIGVSVRETTMPDVAVTPLASDAQRTAFVLNLRSDTPLFGTGVSPSLGSRMLALVGDRFDFLGVLANVSTNNNRFYAGVRNDARGIGLPVFDNSASYGSAGRLRGIVNYPLDEFFDTQSVLAHEIGHAWINFATDPILRSGVPHWPLSNLANESVMGLSIGGQGGAGGSFPWGLTAVGNGSYRLDLRTPANQYTTWDLYLMGLLPPDSVTPAVILPSTLNPSALTPGQITTATTYTIGAYVAVHGTRTPTYASRQTDFAIAMVVLSYGRLLSPSEMAYYDAVAARAESAVSLPLTTGFAQGLSPTFWVVSGGRARIRSRLN